MREHLGDEFYKFTESQACYYLLLGWYNCSSVTWRITGISLLLDYQSVNVTPRAVFSQTNVSNVTCLPQKWHRSSLQWKIVFQNLQLEGEDLKRSIKVLMAPRALLIGCFWSLGDYGRSRVSVKKLKQLFCYWSISGYYPYSKYSF